MKIIIQTQISENYGSHDWSGEGECPQHWKNKGGSTYIFAGVSIDQAQDREFYESCKKSVRNHNESWAEDIIDFSVVDDCVSNSDYHADWESPVMIEHTEAGFVGSRITSNEGEYRTMKREIKEKRETWLQQDGEREEYLVEFIKTDGTVLNWKGEAVLERSSH